MAENNVRSNEPQKENKTTGVTFYELDSNLKEIIIKADKQEKLSKEEIEALKKEALESVNFVDKIDEIDLKFDKYVVFTDGNDQLIYENGEFFVVSTTDSKKKKEKKKKEEAKNMYLEYFIRYVLNPIIKQKQMEEHSKVAPIPIKEKTREKAKVKEKEKEERVKVVSRPKEKTKDDDDISLEI